MMNFLNRPLLGLPLWIWLLVVLGGVLIAVPLIKKFTGGGSSNSLGSGQTTTTTPDANIDPNTGIPYAVETATNPATGLPNYNNLVGLQSTTNGIAASQGNGVSFTNQQALDAAIAEWENHTGQQWTGPTGSFPAGWGPTPQAPGAATQYGPGKITYVTPPQSASV